MPKTEKLVGGTASRHLPPDIHRTGIPASRLTEITKGRRAITADTALRLGRFFGTGERFWLNRQQAYDLEKTRMALGRRLETEVEPLSA